MNPKMCLEYGLRTVTSRNNSRVALLSFPHALRRPPPLLTTAVTKEMAARAFIVVILLTAVQAEAKATPGVASVGGDNVVEAGLAMFDGVFPSAWCGHGSDAASCCEVRIGWGHS